MATLTNTKIKDTYDGLLKTADNDVIGASEKNITDGLGNATVLSIGTGSASFSSDIEVNGLTIGKGNGSITQNTAIGVQALDNATGIGNTAVGYASLLDNTTGVQNTAVGLSSLRYNTTGNYNVAIGSLSLDANIDGSDNIAVGYSSLSSNTLGSQNVAIGRSSLSNNTTGGSNTALGYNALSANIIGSSNVAVGRSALISSTTGSFNTAVGTYSLNNNTTGSDNLAIGYRSLYNTTIGGLNIAVGNFALDFNTTGLYNTALGHSALYSNETGGSNVAVGYHALRENTASNNTSVGHASLTVNTTGTFNSAFGKSALNTNTTGSYNVAVGTNSLLSNTDGDSNVAVGYAAGDSKTSGDRNIYIGNQADGGSATTSNEIVIGSLVTGKGSDTAIIGGDDIYLGNGTLGKVSIERGANTLLEIVETSHSETLKIQSNYIGGQAIYGTTTLDHVFYIGASEKMRIGSSTVDITGDLTSGGNVDIAGDLTSGGNVHIVGDLTVGGTMPSSDLDLTGTPYGEGDILTVSSSGTLTKIDKDTAAEYLGVNSVSLMRDLSFGESYINNFRSRVIDNTGTYFPTPTGYNFGVYKNKGYVNKMGVALLPSGVKSGGLFSVKPSNGNGDFDFTRASTATYVDEDGLIAVAPSGTPRLDYPIIDGVVQDTPSLLLEPARTNSVTYSEDISSYFKVRATITSNAETSPDGLSNASALVATAVNDDHFVYDAPTVTDDIYTYSVFLKKGSKSWARLWETNTNVYVDFNLEIGATGSSFGTIIESGAEDYGNGWYRCYITYDTGSAGSKVYRIYPLEGDDDKSFLGDGTSEEIYIYGAQVEAGSYPTSYIPTSGSAVTRNAEVCNGAGTSADFNDSEGVLFAEISALADDGTTRRISISDSSATVDNRITLEVDETNATFKAFLSSGGTTEGALTATTSSQTNNNKIALKYALNDFEIWINGFLLDTDSVVASIPIGLSNLQFRGANNSNDFYGKTKQLITFKEALTDAELEELTSWQSFNDMAEAQEYKTY